MFDELIIDKSYTERHLGTLPSLSTWTSLQLFPYGQGWQRQICIVSKDERLRALPDVAAGAGDVASAVDSPVVSWDCSALESPSEHN